MQVGFEYNYSSSNDIIAAAIKNISNMGIQEYIGLLGVVIIIYVCVYYIFPLISILHKYYKREQEKTKRKLMLRQISLQKDIEDEIEAEIEQTTQKQSQI